MSPRSCGDLLARDQALCDDVVDARGGALRIHRPTAPGVERGGREVEEEDAAGFSSPPVRTLRKKKA